MPLNIEPEKSVATAQDLAAPDEAAAESAADGWETESHSADPELPPDDTTARASQQDQPDEGDQPDRDSAPDDDSDGTESRSHEGAETQPREDGDHVSASGESARDRKRGKKSKDPAEQRTSRLDELQNKINEATWRYNETLRRTEELEARLRDQNGHGQPPPAPAGQPDQPAAAESQADEKADPFPVAPNYTDFGDEESYKAATTKWQSDVTGWHERRAAKLRQELTGGLEERLTAQQNATMAEKANQEFQGRMAEAKQRHEDFDDVAKNVASLRSSWAFGPDGTPVNGFRDPDTGRPVAAPFLWDIVKNTHEGPELLYYLGQHAEDAAALAELKPNLEIRNAIIHAPSPARLMAHFATPQGRGHFEQLKAMHPVALNQHIGLLSAQVAAAPRDPTPPAPQPITSANPPARSPRGTPRAHDTRKSEDLTFDEWMEKEDEREREEWEKAHRHLMAAPR